ncbi:TFIIB-type zinc ribbon-containing protein [Trichlorobacter ammonificans]|uniref:Transcription factor zinc-finger domain-containing protein n=1 Tax=Trichlorobacter ammonificans TaxID=2916410 RepID=A0ABM9D564_9BACT|nr:zf-TFIIB domain-containing protein [Trichlorobacter ammonificans]CAH2030383.1 conserved protein of unknown function [Trichlorobacter ammonificans]
MARCSNCNAPLPPGSLICAYCNNRNDIDLRGIHYYTTHESDTPRTCPRCTIRLKHLDLKLHGRFLIDRCEQCLGLFFDPGELDALLEAMVGNVFDIDHVGLALINEQRSPDRYPVSYLKCPACSQVMHRVNFGARSGVIVDRCKAHGIWLDGGELRQLLEWMKLGGRLLEREHQERKRAEAVQREREQHRELRGIDSDTTWSFDSFSEPLRHSAPDLFDLILKAFRLFR